MRFFWLCLLAGCSGGAHQIEIGAPPAKVTEGVYAGPLCSGDTCKCASGPADGGAGVPEDDKKRFEVRLNSPNELWLQVGDNRMYKDAERVEACWYMDLAAPGETAVAMRASKEHGVSATWSIRELGTKTKSYYDTLVFGCGNPGACSFEELDTKKAELKDPKHDHCGSTIVKGLTWDTGRSPDQQYPNELLVTAKLKIYKFVPDRPHGEDCAKKQTEEHDEDNPKM
ncbi:MAG TPA: hypothetical protein VFV99_33910 [Kofleriaceae bacterium]|nr:hypothetical protein [Kofleriaceae bacterium]